MAERSDKDEDRNQSWRKDPAKEAVTGAAEAGDDGSANADQNSISPVSSASSCSSQSKTENAQIRGRERDEERTTNGAEREDRDCNVAGTDSYDEKADTSERGGRDTGDRKTSGKRFEEAGEHSNGSESKGTAGKPEDQERIIRGLPAQSNEFTTKREDGKDVELEKKQPCNEAAHSSISAAQSGKDNDEGNMSLPLEVLEHSKREGSCTIKVSNLYDSIIIR